MERRWVGTQDDAERTYIDAGWKSSANDSQSEPNGSLSSVIGFGRMCTTIRRIPKDLLTLKMFCRPHECRLSHQRTSADQVWSQWKESPRLVKGKSSSHYTLHVLFHMFTELIMSQILFTRRRVDVDWVTHAINQRFNRIECHWISTLVYSFISQFIFFEEKHLINHLIVSQYLNHHCEQWSCIELDLCQVNTN